ncbi:uncharacterized protein LOC119388421 [Rhipicephalus sanguineus]|uniref:uncharacterized protein LOC119388421 n=1 Tax=Rhipicephalus sanguineus TaxID=34632 RepID=UPI00189346C1|nr:uncharacterized protein LOC119388421 [Rhipicephalus sanguineus]
MNWLVFRDIRTKEERPREIFEDIISSIKAAVHKATKEIETSAELAVPAIDPTLLHSLEAINTLSGRWKKPKLSRRLRTKISELNKEIETHAKKLAAQQWDEVCKEADGTMRKGSKWSLLKNQLTDSNKPSKSSARLEIGRLMHMHTNDGDDPYTFADKLADIYIPLENKSILWDNSRSEYQGFLQSALDRPFEFAEIVHALWDFNGRWEPGPDGITNKLLRNLDNAAIEVITWAWSDGKVPEEWRTAKVVFIPKRGKFLQIESLRTLSHTSCLGKVAEHDIHNRISEHIGDEGLFRHSMVGFRKSLSTQDTMLLIKSAVIDSTFLDIKVILALDLTKTFDTLTQEHIQNESFNLSLGETFHTLV